MSSLADRVISYEFRGRFASLTAGLTASSKAVSDFGTKLTALDKQGARMRSGLSDLGGAAGKFGLAAAVGLGAAIAVTAKFESAMSRVAAATNASASDLEALRQAAIKAGADTVFSASEAADGMTELAKAGLSAQDILSGGLSGALDLAAAGQISVSEAAETTAITLQQFSLSGDQATRVADTLAAGAGKAVGGVLDMAGALKYVGPVAAQMGISLEESAGAISELASQGVIGESAGTALRGMLTSLTSPSKAAAKEMDALGISLYDAQGNFVGIDGVAGQLKATMGGLTNAERDQALGRIFGNEQITAARILYSGGSADVEKWTKAVTDSGYAAEQANKLTSNLAGDLEQLKGSFETALINTGDSSTSVLRTTVQSLTDVVNGYSELSPAAHTATAALLGLTAAAGGGAFVFSKAIGGLANLQTSLMDMGVSAERAATSTKVLGRAAAGAAGLGLFAAGLATTNKEVRSLETGLGGAAIGFSVGGPWGAAVGGAVGLVTGLATSHKNTAKDVQALTGAFDQQTGALTENGRVMAATQLAQAGVLDLTERLGISATVATDAALGNADAQKQVAAALREANDAGSLGVEDFPVVEALSTITGTFSAAGDAAGKASEALDATSVATASVGSISDEVAEDVAKLAEALNKQYDAAVGAFDAITQYRTALKAAKEQGDKSNAGIRGSSDEALKNRDALSALAGAWNNQSDAVKNAKGNFAGAQKDFVATATAMGVPQRAAERLADALLQIPPKRVSKVTVDSGNSHQVINDVMYDLSNLKNKTVYINTINRRSGPGGQGPATSMNAAGGYIAGPGTATSDSIPARLSNGEYVIQAKAVNRYGVAMFDSLNAQRFASGGLVSRPLFTDEGPHFYKAAYRHNKPFAKSGPASWPSPYQTTLSAAEEALFEAWVSSAGVPFDPFSRLTDYDMRGFWKRTQGAGWEQGSHFPDTYKTPYDTTFSHESKYATSNNPFYWHGNSLIDQRNGQVVFAADGATVPKTGRGYADRHLYMLADGEEVISNRYGQADRFRSDRANGRIPGYADGGTAGKRSRDVVNVTGFSDSARDMGIPELRGMRRELAETNRALNHSTAALDAQTDAVSRETSARDDLVSQMGSLASSIAGQFDSNLFEPLNDVWGSNRTTSDPISVLMGDLANSAQFSSLFAGLQGRGLSGGALTAAAQGGVAGLQAVGAYSDADLARYADLYAQREASRSNTGQQVAMAQFGQALADQQGLLDEANRQRTYLIAQNDQLIAAAHAQTGAVKSVEDATKDNGKATSSGRRSKVRKG